MEKDKEKWIEEVFDSLKGSERAKPSADLFAKIENLIDAPEAKIIPMPQWRVAAAAAVAILFLNVFAVQQFRKINRLNNNELVVDSTSDQQLISNYKIYE
jgi:hypothetical protein